MLSETRNDAVNRLGRGGAIAVGIVALLAFGMFGGAYQSQVSTLAAIYIILATSLNLLLGYSGLLSLGHQAFFGVGAYASAVLTTKLSLPMPLGLVGAAVVAAAVGWVIGKITLRLRAAFFVIATFAVAEIGRQVALNWVSLTGGPIGYSGIPPVGIGPIELVEPQAVYPVVLALALIIVLLVARLAQSGLGYSLRGLAQNENMARAVGVDTARHANLAFTLGSGMAAVAGSLYAHTVGFISPEVFSFSIMINTLLMVIGGGLGTVIGPVIGAVIFSQLPETLRFSDEWRLVVYGLVLVLLVRFLPRGLWGTLAALMKDRGRRAGRRGRAPSLVTQPPIGASGTESLGPTGAQKGGTP
jgi:branched-chain amino acid transport system permease protein